MVKKNTKKTQVNTKANKQNGSTGNRTGSGSSSGGKTRKAKHVSDKSKDSGGSQVTPPTSATVPTTANGARSTGQVSDVSINGGSVPNGDVIPGTAEDQDEVPQQDPEEAEAQRLALVAERVDTVLRGRMDDLPSLCSKIVRIFTSSTFTGNKL